jgi:hypothetical protein
MLLWVKICPKFEAEKVSEFFGPKRCFVKSFPGANVTILYKFFERKMSTESIGNFDPAYPT